MGGLGNRLDVEDVAARIRDGFTEESDGLGVGEGFPGFSVERVGDETNLNPEAAQGVLQQCDGAAVKGTGGDDVVSRVCQVEDREGGCGLS